MSSSMGECHRSEAVLICSATSQLPYIVRREPAHRINKLDTRKIHVVLRKRLENFRVVNRLGSKMLVI